MFKILKKIIPKQIKDHFKENFFHTISMAPFVTEIIEKNNDNASAIEQISFLLSENKIIPPIPPKHLQIRVSSAYYGNFLNHGKEMMEGIDSMLKKHGYSVSGFNQILDFGCGCGRFLIPLSFKIDRKKLSGTDIDPEAVNWMKANYPDFKDIDTNGVNPPTKHSNDSFDFIFSISIFTHLPEEMHMNWIKELSRILQPGGIGVFSIHGEFYYHLISENDRAELLEKGFKYTVGYNTDGLPDFYQSAFHTHDYIRREWGKYFEIVDIVKQGIGNGQDAVILRKK